MKMTFEQARIAHLEEALEKTQAALDKTQEALLTTQASLDWLTRDWR
jgi:hypothetical protein